MRVDPALHQSLRLDGVVLTLTLATGLIFPFALFLEGLITAHFAGDVLHLALDALTKRRGLFTDARIVARLGGIVRIVAVVKLVHVRLLSSQSATWRS